MDCLSLPRCLGLVAWLALYCAPAVAETRPSEDSGAGLARAPTGATWRDAAGPARGQDEPGPVMPVGFRFRSRAPQELAATRIDLGAVAPEYRERVLSVLERPALHASGRAESFHCKPPVYHWLLDHPDRAVRIWRKLGATCAEVTDRGNGIFGWKDEHGSDISWQTVIRTPQQRVWLAEGVVRPGALLPQVSVRALFVLHITQGEDASGRSAIRHQGELLLHTDGRAATLATRLVGASAPQMARDYIGQIQIFFGALAWHLDEHPEKIRNLLKNE
jgi:hypothetical protein